MENNEVFEVETNNEVTEVVNDSTTPVAEEKKERGLSDVVIDIAVAGLATVGAVTVGKTVAKGAKKLFGKLTSKFGKSKKEPEDTEVEAEDVEEAE